MREYFAEFEAVFGMSHSVVPQVWHSAQIRGSQDALDGFLVIGLLNGVTI